MSKQYLTLYIAEDAHPVDIYALAATRNQLLSVSGGKDIKIYDTTSEDFPLVQSIENAHAVGCSHLATSADGKHAASLGFEGDVKLWESTGSGPDCSWIQKTGIVDTTGVGHIWGLGLSEDAGYLVSSSQDGTVRVWNTTAPGGPVHEMETRGIFGTCVAVSSDGKFVASGHRNGSVYVFSNETGRLIHNLPAQAKTVRTIAFSPAGKFLAAAGDSRLIYLYDVASGEQVATLTGSAGWIMSIDFNETGEYLLSGSFDGKAKVWSVDTHVCVATQGENDETLWSVKWLPKVGHTERFAVGGANRSISFYREATGADKK